jgi:hypothetical protein
VEFWFSFDQNVTIKEKWLGFGIILFQ